MNSYVEISVEWADETHSLRLKLDEWNNVQAGDLLVIDGEGYHYEGEFFSECWEFNKTKKNSLKVRYGTDGGEGFVGNIGDAVVMKWHHLKESWPSGRLPSSERWDTFIGKDANGTFYIRVTDGINADDIVELANEAEVLNHQPFIDGEPSLEEIGQAVESIDGYQKLCEMIKNL